MLSSENQNTEYKRTWSDEYLKWICGFANAQGGRIYIGVADDRTVIGLTDTELHRLSEDIPNKVRDVLGIIVDVNTQNNNGKQYIKIVVEPSSVPINYHGQYHYRSGATKQELKGIALQEFILKKMGKQWDDIGHETATLDADLRRDLRRNTGDYSPSPARKGRFCPSRCLSRSPSRCPSRPFCFEADNIGHDTER